MYGIFGVGYLTKISNIFKVEEKIPDEWKESILIPIFKNKGDIMSCGNHRGINLGEPHHGGL